jgi:hypothetical protein
MMMMMMMMIAAVSAPATKDRVLSENRHVFSIRNEPQERQNFRARSLHRQILPFCKQAWYLEIMREFLRHKKFHSKYVL